MKDVIFGGGHGIKGSSSAEVEVVIDNGDRVLDSDFSEISIVRRLSRDGEGEYRLNGARCRLVDIIEVLSTWARREMHSVVSQGKVEAIVLSRPRERRLMIEEAAGLGKHRKRRRRAQLKLERTEENLSRALDVEREARSHLRPLKRQAEAAELHQRIERQSLEAQLRLAGDDVRAARRAERAAEARSTAARPSATRPSGCWPRSPGAARRRRRRSRRSRGCGSSSRAACLPLARRPSGSASGSSGRATRRIPPPSAASAAARSSRSWRSSCAPTTVPPTPPTASPSWRPSSPDWSSSVSAG